MSTTLYDIAKSIKQTTNGRAVPNAKPVTTGLKPRKFSKEMGLRLIEPEELANVHIARLEVNGTIEGYQRPAQVAHIRKIARAIGDGVEMPPVNISVDDDGIAWITDGQHRSLGSIIAREPIWAVVQHRSQEDAALLFSNQRYAIKPTPALAILTGNDELDLYIQDAVTRDDHPWSHLIAPESSPRHHIGPQTAKMLLANYVFNTINLGKIRISDIMRGENAPSMDYADECAALISCFGTKDTNPIAFSPLVLRAIGTTAVRAVRRSDRHEADLERWCRWMPTFPFNGNAHIRSSVNWSSLLIDHWNKRLSNDRRISK